MFDLENRVALVTGSSRGIGEGVALALAEAGAAVAVNYRSRAAEAEAVVDTIKAVGGRAAAFRGDVSLHDDVQAMVRAIEEQLGSIDILVNNAGMVMMRGLDNVTEEDFDRDLAVNLKSAFLCTQAVLPGMRARNWGRVVFISSIGAHTGNGPPSLGYVASKAGLEGLMRGYAQRLASEGVTANAVAPGLIETEMAKPLINENLIAHIPVGRAGQPEDIALAVLMLVHNGYMTGQTIAVNGGVLLS
ncbi:SDR family NAD(P)-dependent oxidoreductase [Pleomorphomonas sp. NRK KF1]|uniref:SDR family NAD(P)-dependent oxidoreductase n=1 Tax=Pleomorphomonas sp. NRK KF1 TaxID=2943000 RepID=UPI0020441416|nr:SDR family oxidoreductase [Pleomorphomonas sp. NRK KF1]MCM5553362.1 SDR family oxidoreductase [Pleomorphomonas sp. NRK KF1]